MPEGDKCKSPGPPSLSWPSEHNHHPSVDCTSCMKKRVQWGLDQVSKVEGTRSACPYHDNISVDPKERSIYRPSLNHFSDTRVLMNPTVVHNDNRIFIWVGLHFIKKTLNELSECLSRKRPLNDAAVKDTTGK
jgi:hypothetical protein